MIRRQDYAAAMRAAMGELSAAGKYTLPVMSFPVTDAATAYRHLVDRTAAGKVVLTFGPSATKPVAAKL